MISNDYSQIRQLFIKRILWLNRWPTLWWKEIYKLMKINEFIYSTHGVYTSDVRSSDSLNKIYDSVISGVPCYWICVEPFKMFFDVDVYKFENIQIESILKFIFCGYFLSFAFILVIFSFFIAR